MKKAILASALLILVCSQIFSQNRKYIYAELDIIASWTTNGYRLAVDMGTPQETDSDFRYNCIKDSDGKDMVFNTKINAVNWMARDGWELLDNCRNIDSTFIMKKDVSGMTEEQVNRFLSGYRIGPSGGTSGRKRVNDFQR